jgi:hypothetical protein
MAEIVAVTVGPKACVSFFSYRTYMSNLTPVLRSLRGVLKNADIKEYKKHLTRSIDEKTSPRYRARGPALWFTLS